MSGEVIDVEAVEEKAPEPEAGALIPAVPPRLAVTPQVPAAELKERLDVIQEAQREAMQEGVDYGVIPGTDKPTLFKPGSEKLSVLFQLDVQLDNEKEWGPGDHLTVVSKATVYHAPTGARLGYGEGVCTTRERKYAYRKKNRACPTCKAEAIIKGKEEYGGGWVCWKKRDGCGAEFKDDDPAIVEQEAGDIENPDLPDLWNTVVKMAEKRARVDAVLAVTGASALFTQDMEDTATATAETRTASSPPKASEKQLDELDRQAKKKLPPADAELVQSFARVLSGPDVSRAIDAIKKDKEETVNELIDSAATWRESYSDVPADTDGFGSAPADEKDIPF